MFPKLDGYSSRILIFIIVVGDIFIVEEKKKKGKEFSRAPTGRVNSNSKRDSGLTMAHYKHGDAFRRILFNRSSRRLIFLPDPVPSSFRARARALEIVMEEEEKGHRLIISSRESLVYLSGWTSLSLLARVLEDKEGNRAKYGLASLRWPWIKQRFIGPLINSLCAREFPSTPPLALIKIS